jgi:hypothetical protein
MSHESTLTATVVQDEKHVMLDEIKQVCDTPPPSGFVRRAASGG